MNDDTKGTNPSHNFNNDADQAARLSQLREDQRARNGAAGDDGGRPYAQAGPTAPTAAPIVAPEWSHPVVPPERPLGWRVDELPDMRTVNGVNVADDSEWEYPRPGIKQRSASDDE